MEDFDRLSAETRTAIDAATDPAALEAVRVASLGKKGAVTGLMKNLATLDADAKRAYGAKVNALKDEITARIEARRAAPPAPTPTRPTRRCSIRSKGW